jgi:hypothetical protein
MIAPMTSSEVPASTLIVPHRQVRNHAYLPVMTRSVAGNLVVTLRAPAKVRAGEAIPISMRIENKSAETLELYLRGREPTYDFIVTARDGDVVWRRLEGEVVPAILRVEVLEPAQILYFRENWDQRDNAGELVPPGSYTIQGTVLTDGSSTLESPAVPLRIDRK